jgi:branched-chain amino acid transport system ATP-binding protein
VTNDAPLLRLEGLCKAFGGLRAVDECAFAVAEKRVMGLIGPNGAGKSTTIDLISGFKQPDSGTIEFAGRQIQGLPAYRVSRLGLMRTFQTSREWPHLTVMQNMLVAFPPGHREAVWRAFLTRRALRRAEDLNRVRAREVLAEFGLERLKNEYAGNLSGGQKRLLEFARIVIARPRMVLLDEPLAGVNPVLGKRIAEAIGQLRNEGITLLLVEHNLPFVDEVCDSVIVMAQGRQIAEGSLDELRQNPVIVDAYLGEVTTGG